MNTINFEEYLNLNYIFIIDNIKSLIQTFLNESKYNGPGALVMERIIEKNNNRMRYKDQLNWYKITEIRFLYGENYFEELAKYDLSSDYIYIIVAMSIETENKSESSLYKVNMKNFDIELMEFSNKKDNKSYINTWYRKVDRLHQIFELWKLL